MPYQLGKRSLERLEGVHPNLVALAKRAIEITQQDFSVICGVRTIEQQRELMNSDPPRTKTLHSRHLVQDDGFGHAIDVAPYMSGRLSWKHIDFYPVVAAFSQASIDLGMEFRPGCVWDRRLSEIGQCVRDVESSVNAYVERREGKTFLDFPHTEILR